MALVKNRTASISKKKIVTFAVVLTLLASVPIALLLVQRQTKLKSSAAEFDAYDVTCEEDPSIALISVSEPTEFYDEASGTYTLQWTLSNNTDKALKIHAESLACRAPDPNAQATPAEILADPENPYPERFVLGLWPDRVPSDPPTAEEFSAPWRYCAYDFTSNQQYLANTQEEINEKLLSAPQTSPESHKAIEIPPGEQLVLDKTIVTSNAEVNYCGSFLIKWDVLRIETEEGQICTPRKLPGQLKSTMGIIITGDGQVDGKDFSAWRPDGVETIGDVCVEKITTTHTTCSYPNGPGTGGVCEEVPGSGESNCSVAQNDPANGINPLCPPEKPPPPPPGQFSACVDMACVVQEGLSRNLCGSNADCRESICTSDNTCEEVAISDLKDGDVKCSESTDCNLRQVCQGDACIVKRGPRKSGDISCTPETAGEVCTKYYTTCENLQCVQKEGDKGSSCDEDSDCFRNVCDASNACVSVADTSNQPDLCGSDSDCRRGEPPPETHNSCVGEACVAIPGAGADTCTTDPDCQDTTLIETHNECLYEACVGVQGPGVDECATDPDCEIPDETTPPQTTYNVCLNEACVTTQGVGTDECSTDTDCALPVEKEPSTAITSNNIPYYTTCRNEMCVKISGKAAPGTQLCTSNLDCQTTPPPPPQEGGTYKTCLNNTCVVLSGTPSPETPLCSADADCPANEPIRVPETGVEEGALAISAIVMALLFISLRLVL